MIDDFTAKSGTHWAVRWYPCEPQRAQARERSDSRAPRALASLGSADVCRLALALELGAFVEGEFLVCHHTPTYQCSLT